MKAGVLGALNSVQPTCKAAQALALTGVLAAYSCSFSEKWGVAMVEDTVPSRTWDGYLGALSSTGLTVQGLHGPSLHFVETSISYINVKGTRTTGSEK